MFAGKRMLLSAIRVRNTKLHQVSNAKSRVNQADQLVVNEVCSKVKLQELMQLLRSVRGYYQMFLLGW